MIDSSPYHDHASIRHGMGGSRQLGVQIDPNTFQLGRRGSGGSVMASAHGLLLLGSGSGMVLDSDIARSSCPLDWFYTGAQT